MIILNSLNINDRLSVMMAMDARTNSLILKASDEKLAIVEELMKELDTEPTVLPQNVQMTQLFGTPDGSGYFVAHPNPMSPGASFGGPYIVHPVPPSPAPQGYAPQGYAPPNTNVPDSNQYIQPIPPAQVGDPAAVAPQPTPAPKTNNPLPSYSQQQQNNPLLPTTTPQPASPLQSLHGEWPMPHNPGAAVNMPSTVPGLTPQPQPTPPANPGSPMVVFPDGRSMSVPATKQAPLTSSPNFTSRTAPQSQAQLQAQQPDQLQVLSQSALPQPTPDLPAIEVAEEVEMPDGTKTIRKRQLRLITEEKDGKTITYAVMVPVVTSDEITAPPEKTVEVEEVKPETPQLQRR
jgi:hypothetical protein